MAGLRAPAARLLIGAMLLVDGGAAFAADDPPPIPGASTALPGDADGEGLRIRIEHIELQPITAEELAGGTALPQSGAPMIARPDGRGLRADGGLQVTPLRATIEREVRDVWEFRRRTDAGTGGVPRVRVEMEGAGAFAGETSAGTPLPVRVRPSRISRRRESDGTEVFTGGVILEIPVATLPQTGRFRGRLRITVEEI